MTVYRSLAYAHNRCYSRERHAFGKSHFHDATGLRRDIVIYHIVYPLDCLLVGPFLFVIFLIIEKITLRYALVDPAVAYMIETAVADSLLKIPSRNRKVGISVEQGHEHIMDDVARKIIVVQKRHGQPVHLRIM